MNKIICDVCGTDYPETAAQCPICGCAAAGAQTSSANEAPEAEERAYTYVKGGRYSKANVRKRLKANQAYYDQPLASDAEAEYEDDQDEAEEEDDQGSNRGLVVLVVILLLAIVAVGSYIAITFFDIKLPEIGSKPTTTQGTPDNDVTTVPTTTEPAATKVACTDLVVNVENINLTSDTPWILSVIPEPENTTDTITYISGDLNVATVSETGVLNAVGNGETTITIVCGDVVKEVTVICTLEESVDPEETEPEETEPEETEPEETDPEETEPAETKTYALRINGRKPNYGTEQAAEATIKIGEELNIKVVDENGQRVEVEWTASKSGIVSIGSNTVTGESAGTVVITAEIDGQELVCTFRVKA